MKNQLFCWIIGLFLCIVLLFSFNREAPPLDQAGWFNVQAHWRLHQVIVLFRHVERCDRSNSPCLNDPKGISIAGQTMAQKLAPIIAQKLDLSQAVIKYSDKLRTQQTAHILFPGRGQAVKWLKKDCHQKLFDRLFSNKPQDKNMILIGHSTCMRGLGEAQGQALMPIDVVNERSYGLAVFIAIDQAHHRAYPLGYLRPQDWSSI